MSDWKKSSYSGAQSECVEVKMTSDEVLVRDTKNREGGTHRLSRDAWASLVLSIKRRDYGPR